MSNRDIAGDYLRAYLAEYAAYKTTGQDERAEAVAAQLRALGHDVSPQPKHAPRETAIDSALLETVTEEPAPKRRPGRPTKAADSE